MDAVKNGANRVRAVAWSLSSPVDLQGLLFAHPVKLTTNRRLCLFKSKAIGRAAGRMEQLSCLDGHQKNTDRKKADFKLRICIPEHHANSHQEK